MSKSDDHKTIPQCNSLDPTFCPLRSQDFIKNVDCTLAVISEWTADVLSEAELFIHVCEGTTSEEKEQKFNLCPMIDMLTYGVLSKEAQRRQFSAKEGKSLSVNIGLGSHYQQAALIGIGRLSDRYTDCEHPFYFNWTSDCTNKCCKEEESKSSCLTTNSNYLTPCCMARLGKNLASLISTLRYSKIVISLKDIHVTDLGVQAMIENMLLSLNPDNRFQSKKSNTTNFVKSIHIYVSEGCVFRSFFSDLSNLVHRARHLALGVQSAQDLISAPPNYLNPSTFQLYAESLAQTYPSLKCKILNVSECEALGMGALLAVGKGSMYSPRMIHLSYSSANKDGSINKRIAFVGKGITMDTGGYNLKVNASIEIMKWDMGGAAAVIGAAESLVNIQPIGIEAHFIIATAENAISKYAYRPGDIITAANGKTIEVGNTDAEGRLVLCDALVYAQDLGIDTVIDLATLTGSCLMGLGRNVAGLYGIGHTMMKMIKCSLKVGEMMWPMPLYTPYRVDLNSRIADINNTSVTRHGGSVHAALFLKEFINSSVDWCHIDMPGPVWDYKEQRGTGFAVRTLTLLLELMSKNE